MPVRARLAATAGELVAELSVVHSVGVVEAVLVLEGPVRSPTLRPGAVLIADLAIGFF
jgi:hypothetical protein